MVEEFGGPGVGPVRRGGGHRRLHHPAVPGRAPGGGGARSRTAQRRRCQAPGRLPRGPVAHHGAGPGGRGRHRPPGPDQGGRRGRGRWSTPRWDGAQGPVPVAGRPPVGRRRSGSTARPRPACPSTWAATWAAWRACSTPWPPPTGPGPRSPSPTSSRSWARPDRSPPGTSPTPSTPARRPRPCSVLRRMLGAGDSHPLVVMANLHRHYRQILRLDGAGVHLAPRRRPRSSACAAPSRPRRRWPRPGGWGRPGSPGPSSSWPRPTWTSGAPPSCPGRSVLEVLVARLSRLVTRAAVGRMARA